MIATGTFPLLVTSDRQDLFSMAYVQAVIASAGFNVGADKLDRNKQDIYITHQLSADFIPDFMRLNIQVKCTYAHEINKKDQNIHFTLDVDTYNKLIGPLTEPHILVVVLVPRPNDEAWVECVDQHTILRHRAYWICLRGQTKTTNKENVTVYIPEANAFDTNAVYELMGQIAQGMRDL